VLTRCAPVAKHACPRLENLDKSRLDEEEKKLLEIRKNYMHESIGLYIELQQKSFGAENP